MTLVVLAALGGGAVGASAQTVDATAFSSIELSNGGTAVVRYGATHSVRIVSGDPRQFDVRIDGTRLRINRCSTCKHERGRTIEVVTPALESVTVTNGGTIALVGEFPAQTRLVANVSQGGAIDARRLTAAQVTASVEQGGGIFTSASRQLNAAVTQGGAITYWGDPAVRSNVQHGGVVQRGRAEDASRPLGEVGAGPVPPLPPAPSRLLRL